MKYSGIDLHSNNSVVTVTDEEDRVVTEKRMPNDLAKILGLLMPWQEELAGVVVESTYNWYWLVDGLQAAGFKVHLANTTAIKKYEGLTFHSRLGFSIQSCRRASRGLVKRFLKYISFATARCLRNPLTKKTPKLPALAGGNPRSGLEPKQVQRDTAWAYVDIVSTQPSSATPVVLKSSFAGVAVVTCLLSTRLRLGLAISMAVCLVQPPG